MEQTLLSAIAFVVIDTIAGSIAGRLLWHYKHQKEFKEANPQYSFATNWVFSAVVFVGLMWICGQIRQVAAPTEETKFLATCFMLLSAYLVGWRPTFFWRR